MVTPGAKREAVAHAREHHGVSERRACALVGVNRRVIRYEPTRLDDMALRQRLRELAAERRRFGYRRLGYLLAGHGRLDEAGGRYAPLSSSRQSGPSISPLPFALVPGSLPLRCADWLGGSAGPHSTPFPF